MLSYDNDLPLPVLVPMKASFPSGENKWYCCMKEMYHFIVLLIIEISIKKNRHLPYSVVQKLSLTVRRRFTRSTCYRRNVNKDGTGMLSYDNDLPLPVLVPMKASFPSAYKVAKMYIEYVVYSPFLALSV
jgi:hypothetical protein